MIRNIKNIEISNVQNVFLECKNTKYFFVEKISKKHDIKKITMLEKPNKWC
jgi:hypothetical protein